MHKVGIAPPFSHHQHFFLGLFIFAIVLLLPCGITAQTRWNSQYQRYVDDYKDVAIKEMKKWKIPASITLAQGLLESGAGNSELTRKGNNHFGIKCHGWTGRTVHVDDDLRNECFRAYRSALDSYEDHSRFLATSQRYSRLFKLKTTDYKGWAHGLKACGYATNPRYAQKLIEIIEVYKLYRYDSSSGKQKLEEGFYGSRNIMAFNKNLYIYARRGDTFRSLGKELGISYRSLARYNERDKRDELEEGEVVWLKKKRTRAPRDFRHRPHTVRAGESMYSISQKYGIRLRCLYRMNKLQPDYQISVGDELRIR